MTSRLRASSAPPRLRLGFSAAAGVDSRTSRALAALGPLLVGYDLAAAAGALVTESFVYDYCVDWHNYLREDCKSPIADLPGPWTTLMARYLVAHHVGAFVGAATSTRLTDRFGRRRVVSCAAVVYCVAIGAAFIMPQHWRRLLLTARAAQGFAVSLFSTALSRFALEIAPSSSNSSSRCRFDLSRDSRIAFSVGMVLATAANALMERRILGWRKSNAGAALIPLTVMFAIPFFPASPKWTYFHKGRDEAEKVLRRLRGSSHVQFELDALAASADDQKCSTPTAFTAWKPALAALFMHLLQQATGIGAVLAFSALIFKDVVRAGLSASMLLSLAYLLGSVSADPLSRVLGRRRLLLFGAASMAASHSVTAALYWTLCDGAIDRADDARCSDTTGWLLSWTTAWFVFSFAASWGPFTTPDSLSSDQPDRLPSSAAPPAVSWITRAVAVQIGMALLVQARLNDIFFVLSWLCGYAGLFIYVFPLRAADGTSDDCSSVRTGREKLSECLEKRSRALLKTV